MRRQLHSRAIDRPVRPGDVQLLHPPLDVVPGRVALLGRQQSGPAHTNRCRCEFADAERRGGGFGSGAIFRHMTVRVEVRSEHWALCRTSVRVTSNSGFSFMSPHASLQADPRIRRHPLQRLADPAERTHRAGRAQSRARAKSRGAGSVETYGSGRTDAGVHALASGRARRSRARRLPPATLVARVNDALPHDINVLAAERVPRAVSRAPQRRRAQLPLPDRAAPHGVRQAVRLVGARAARRRAHARRRRERCVGLRRLPRVHRRRPGREVDAGAHAAGRRRDATATLVLIRVVGSHFLWKMVRRLVGVLADVGRKDSAPGDVARLLLDAVRSARATHRARVRPLPGARLLRRPPARPARCEPAIFGRTR